MMYDKLPWKEEATDAEAAEHDRPGYPFSFEALVRMACLWSAFGDRSSIVLPL